MTASDLWVDVNLGDLPEDVAGNVDVPVVIGFSDEFYRQVYEVVDKDSPYTVSVRIRSAAEEGL